MAAGRSTQAWSGTGPSKLEWDICEFIEPTNLGSEKTRPAILIWVWLVD